MPVFENSPRSWSREDWRLLQNGFVHLYWRPGILDRSVDWLRSHGYHVVDVDAAGWRSEADLHAGISAALDFPDYYDHNLTALGDCLLEMAGHRYGTVPDAAGTVLVLRHFNGFALTARREAQAFLDIWAASARVGLLTGHRMLALVQSDAARISFAPVGAQPVAWNVAEWSPEQRTS